jgi:hypothetical protein
VLAFLLIQPKAAGRPEPAPRGEAAAEAVAEAVSAG